MANRPQRRCAWPGCRRLTRERHCEVHMEIARQQRQQRDRWRLSAYERGYDGAWNRARKDYLAQHPWCAECAKHGRREPATEVDHIIPHKGKQQLFWDESNWQGLCKPCHSRKTAAEDGGFGHAQRSRRTPPSPKE